MDGYLLMMLLSNVYNKSYNFADRLLSEIRSSGCRGPCNAHRARCVGFKHMFGALPAFKVIPRAVGALPLPTLKLEPG